MPQLIPLIPSEGFYSFTSSLEGVEYLFDVNWNGRTGLWSFDISDATGNLISAGNTIVLSNFPMYRESSALAPPGVFVILDTSGTGVDAGFDELGTRVVMHYYTVDEILAL